MSKKSSKQKITKSSKSPKEDISFSQKEKPNIPWIEKYRPKSIKEMIGFESSIITKIKNFLENFENKIMSGKLSTKERAILLEGPPGVGKTTIVYAIANDLGYSVVELNASDTRTEEAINKKLKECTENTNILSFILPATSESVKLKRKIIFIDEVDGISGQSDRGGLSALLKIIKTTKNPIILAANFYDTKFKTLYDNVEKIQCHSLKKPSIIKILKNIAINENLNLEETVLNLIAENSSGDVRSAINDLQALAQGSLTVEDIDVNKINMSRDIEIKMYNLVQEMFKQKSLIEAREIASNTDLDYNILHKVIYSNLSLYVPDIFDYTEALKNLSEADKLITNINRKMDFSLLPYFFDLVSGGVVFSVKKPNILGFKKFIFPTLKNIRISLIEQPLVEILQKYYNKSKTQIIYDVLPFLKLYIKSLPSDKKEIFINEMVNELNIEKEDIQILL